MLQVTRSIQPKLLAQQAFPIVVSTENKLHSSSSRPTSHQAWRLSRSSDRAKLSLPANYHTHQRTSSAEMEDQASLDGCELKFAQGSGLNDQKEYPGTSQRSYDGGSKNKPIVILGSFIHSISIDRLEFISPNGLMIIDSSGTIVCLESAPEPWTNKTLKEKLKSCSTDHIFQDPLVNLQESVRLIALRRGEFFIPGFVDTHTHAVQYQNIGAGQQYTLLDWLKYITFPEEIRFEDELYAKRMFEKVVSRSIRVGTTTSCYYSSIHLSAAKILAKVCHQAGQRAFIGKCNIDRNDAADHYKEASAEESVEDTIQFINFVRKECATSYHGSSPHHKSIDHTDAVSLPDLSSRVVIEKNGDYGHSMVQPILTPRFAISCTEKLLGKLGELMKTDNQLRLQTHLSESLSEIEYTKQLFPACSTYSEVYDSFGLLTERTILAHCIHLEPSELKLLAKRGCGLSHCPTSNFNLRSGICQVQTLLAAGFEKLSLGTDVSGGYGVGILSTIRDAASAAKVLGFTAQTDSGSADNRPQQLSIENLVYLATLGGARVCNLEDRVGNFALGKQFDGLLIQTGAADAKPAPQNRGSTEEDDAHRRFSQWIVASQAEPYLDGSNPNFFIDEQSEEVDLSRLLEKFLFTGDDRNIGSVFINSISVGGSRPLA
ncbi:hypothetical protein MJO28_008292 [Puccinia striiformis f. sp. tritici]|uniref:Uncharacterized protein n=1 Tax=Puccinia striiformis f. sp. tritici TaxID=168172 RepID=A0ACC0EA10_9BASI|nr:hypothetical protein MJO28_008292 [Puccinia striiformis f. sp. tritici]